MYSTSVIDLRHQIIENVYNGPETFRSRNRSQDKRFANVANPRNKIKI